MARLKVFRSIVIMRKILNVHLLTMVISNLSILSVSNYNRPSNRLN